MPQETQLPQEIKIGALKFSLYSWCDKINICHSQAEIPGAQPTPPHVPPPSGRPILSLSLSLSRASCFQREGWCHGHCNGSFQNWPWLSSLLSRVPLLSLFFSLSHLPLLWFPLLSFLLFLSLKLIRVLSNTYNNLHMIVRWPKTGKCFPHTSHFLPRINSS